MWRAASARNFMLSSVIGLLEIVVFDVLDVVVVVVGVEKVIVGVVVLVAVAVVGNVALPLTLPIATGCVCPHRPVPVCSVCQDDQGNHSLQGEPVPCPGLPVCPAHLPVCPPHGLLLVTSCLLGLNAWLRATKGLN